MRNAARHPWTGRTAGLAEKAAGVVRLLAWAAMVGGYGLMLWALSGLVHASERTDAVPGIISFVIEAPRGKAARASGHPDGRP